MLIICSGPKPGFDLEGVERICKTLISLGVDVLAQITTHENSAKDVHIFLGPYDRSGRVYPILQMPVELKNEMRTLYESKTLEEFQQSSRPTAGQAASLALFGFRPSNETVSLDFMSEAQESANRFIA